jgi:hypothetical protein
MWHVLHLIARPIEALLGLFCVLSAIVLYPDEEGKIQSTLEEFWVRVDDYLRLSLSRHTVFFQQVAKLESSWLDRLFGQRLFSVHSVAASACLSVASIFIVFLIFASFESKEPSLFVILGLMLSLAIVFGLAFSYRTRFVKYLDWAAFLAGFGVLCWS